MLSGFSVLDDILSLEYPPSASLEELFALLNKLGNPQEGLLAVHVAGSNGKGSVCLKIATALEAAGYRVGLFTSPHLHCYVERIQVCSELISFEKVEGWLQYLYAMAQGMGIALNFFQYTTLLSMLYFKEMQVDIAVIETGIGGRLDATRVYNPVLCVITSISLDHTRLLGDSKELIAKEKAGICKRNIPLVLGPKASLAPIFEMARSLDCTVLIAEQSDGSYDKENQGIANLACAQLTTLFPKLSAQAIAQGVAYRPSCRMEQIGSFLFDVAHNPDAFHRVFQDIKQRFHDAKVSSMIGMSSDKDVAGCLAIAMQYCAQIFLVQAEGARAAPKEYLAAVLESMGYFDYMICDSIADAIQEMGNDQDSIQVVCGSFYIMDAAKKALSIAYPPFPLSAASIGPGSSCSKTVSAK